MTSDELLDAMLAAVTLANLARTMTSDELLDVMCAAVAAGFVCGDEDASPPDLA